MISPLYPVNFQSGRDQLRCLIPRLHYFVFSSRSPDEPILRVNVLNAVRTIQTAKTNMMEPRTNSSIFGSLPNQDHSNNTCLNIAHNVINITKIIGINVTK